jgi:hypothetical protein
VNAAWIEGMRGANVLVVARELGLATDDRRGWIAPCPSCGRERRNASTPGEKRGAIGTTGAGWSCFPCGAAGDAVDLVAHRLGGARFRELGAPKKADVRAWCERFLRIDTRARPSPGPGIAPAPHAGPKPPPPRSEVLWMLNRACVRVWADEEVRAYLERRGIDPVAVDDACLAFALRADLALPRWARRDGAAWNESGHRLIVPLFDSSGVVTSVLARQVRAMPAEGSPKTTFAIGGRSGLVMACPFARSILARGAVPSSAELGAWWPTGEGAPRLRVIVCEGDSDFLATAVGPSVRARWADADELAPAVIGIESGAWTDAIAARVPDGAEVVIATDADKAGDEYSARIVRTLERRLADGAITASRWTPEKREAA